MKKLLALIGVMLAITVNAQNPPTPPVIPEIQPLSVDVETNTVPTLPEHVNTFLQFLSASSTNWYVATYGIYVSDNKSFGGGVAAAYSLSPYVLSVLRVDYLNDSFWMPSGSMQLQLPIKLMGKLNVTPFAFAGIATLLGGNGDQETGSAVGIGGAGLATRFNDHLGVVYDVEMWSGFSGAQHRFGIYWKF
jgi:hypothetical protein